MVTRETITSGLAELGVLDRSDSNTIDRLMEYSRVLREVAIPLGFVGPGEAHRLLDRHVLESAAIINLIPRLSDVVDVGSGAGLPGIVLACFADIRLTLVESLAKRAQFLKETSTKLELGFDVIGWRAESLAWDPTHREVFDVAVARALALPQTALELTLPFVKVGGKTVLAATAQTPELLMNVASSLGGANLRVEYLSVPGQTEPRSFIIVDKTGHTPPDYPRRVGVPKKRPLGEL